MYQVTDEEIDFILGDIEKRGIVTEDVKYNILDHVCCIIENEMPAGTPFKEFYENTIARFFKKNLAEIEEETRQLITFKYYYAMKRTMKITGFITVFFTVVGALLKFLHLPGAGISIVLGLAFFSLIFIPLNVVMKFRDDNKKQNRLIISIGMLCTSAAGIGILFKIMHWPFANMLMFSSLAVFALIFVPIYFYAKFRDPETKFNGTVHSIFMLCAAGMVFALINVGPSRNVMESVESMEDFKGANIEQLNTNNDALYSEIESSSSEEVELIQNATNKLVDKIDAIKTNLIAKSDKISEAEAEEKKISEVKNPHDVYVVRDHFERSTDEYSYEAFQKAVAEYNSEIAQIDATNSIRPVSIDDLQMTKTMVSVLLLELADIKLQVLSNENSYLSLKKGLLAQN